MLRRSLYSLCILLSLPLASSLVAAEKASNKAAAKATQAPTEVTADIKLPGVVLPREGGGYISLSTDNGFFCLRFFTDKKLPEAPGPFARAFLKWNQPQKVPAAETNILLPGPDGLSLLGNKFVRAPRIFPVYVTLLDSEGKSLASFIFHYKE